MKKVILAILVLAFALFLVLPNLSWAQEDVYKAKCAACHGADGKGSAAGKENGSSRVFFRRSSGRLGRATGGLHREWRATEEGLARFREQGC